MVLNSLTEKQFAGPCTNIVRSQLDQAQYSEHSPHNSEFWSIIHNLSIGVSKNLITT